MRQSYHGRFRQCRICRREEPRQTVPKAAREFLHSGYVEIRVPGAGRFMADQLRQDAVIDRRRAAPERDCTRGQLFRTYNCRELRIGLVKETEERLENDPGEGEQEEEIVRRHS